MEGSTACWNSYYPDVTFPGVMISPRHFLTSAKLTTDGSPWTYGNGTVVQFKDICKVLRGASVVHNFKDIIITAPGSTVKLKAVGGYVLNYCSELSSYLQYFPMLVEIDQDLKSFECLAHSSENLNKLDALSVYNYYDTGRQATIMSVNGSNLSVKSSHARDWLGAPLMRGSVVIGISIGRSPTGDSAWFLKPDNYALCGLAGICEGPAQTSTAPSTRSSKLPTSSVWKATTTPSDLPTKPSRTRSLTSTSTTTAKLPTTTSTTFAAPQASTEPSEATEALATATPSDLPTKPSGREITTITGTRKLSSTSTTKLPKTASKTSTARLASTEHSEAAGAPATATPFDLPTKPSTSTTKLPSTASTTSAAPLAFTEPSEVAEAPANPADHEETEVLPLASGASNWNLTFWILCFYGIKYF